jgi:hypothetical protein
MLTEKQTTNLIALLFFLPIAGIFYFIVDSVLSNNCEIYGAYHKIETRKRFFNGCQFKDNGEWKAIKNFKPDNFKERNS